MKFNQKKFLVAALLFSYTAKGYGVVWVGGNHGDKGIGVGEAPETITVSSNNDRVAVSNNGTFTVGTNGEIIMGSNSTSTVGAIEVQNTGGNLTNNGTISGFSKTAVQIRGDGSATVSATNNGTISVANSGSVGVQVLGSSGEFTNSSTGTISADTGSVGVLAQSGSQIVNNGTIISSGNNTKGIDISGDTTSVQNNNIIKALDKSTGVTVNSGTFKNSGTIQVEKESTGVTIGSHGKFSNEGDIEINGDNSTGIKVTNFSNGDIINSGNITVQGTRAHGIDITNSAQGEIKNTGVINVLGNDKLTPSTAEATGIKVNGKDILLINDGIINSVGAANSESGYNTKGINIENGSAINNGIINASNGGNAVHVKTNFINENIINVSGKSVGISVDNLATSLNVENSKGVINSSKGTIIVEADESGNAGKAVKVAGNGSFINQGNIIVKGGIGISGEKLSSFGKGTIENSGSIYVEGNNSTGIQSNDFNTITNSGSIDIKAGLYTAGMKAIGNSSKVINSEKGVINHLGNGTQTSNAMIAQNGGKAENNGIVNVSGRNSSAMGSSGAEVVSSDPIAFSTVINNGKINVYDNAYGIKLDGKPSKTLGEYNYAQGINKGNITSQNGGAAVYLNGGIFINEGGEILAGEDGKAIIAYNNLSNPHLQTNNIIKLSKNTEGTQSKIQGAIIGGNGLDVLVLDGKNGENIIDGLNISRYEAIVLTKDSSTLENSKISLEYNTGVRDFLEKEKNNIGSSENPKEQSSLTIKNSTLSIDFKDSLGNSNLESPIISADEVNFEGDTYLSFNSSDGRQEFNLSEALGSDVTINSENANFIKTVIWSYDLTDGNLIAKKERYYDVLSNTKLNDFAQLLENKRTMFATGSFNSAIVEAEQLTTNYEFTNALTQLSGGQYAYLSDIALNNLSSVKREIIYRLSDNLDNMNSPINSYTSNGFYLNFKNRLGGLIDVKETQTSAIGTFEKQISENQKMGLFIGGGHSVIDFQSGKLGHADLDIIYAGAFLKNRFSPYLSLISQFGFEHQFAHMNRKIDYTSEKYNFTATTPTMVFSLGSQVDLSVPINRNWNFSIYTGLDWSKVVQGNILEKDEDNPGSTNNELMVRNNTGTFYYDSVRPSAGLKLENSNFILGKKYNLLVNANYETEIGNIKDGKNIMIKKLGEYHRVKTTENGALFSLGTLASLNLTEDFSINGGYTYITSDEYSSDRISGGFKYNFDTLTNPITAPFISLWDGKPVDPSSRFRASLSLSLEGEDLDDRENSGSYQTSGVITPKLKLGINDTKNNFSYYFESYKKNSTWFRDLKNDSFNPEGKAEFFRVHGEVRYLKPSYWGNYGVSLGYRYENGSKQRLIGPSGSQNNPNPLYFRDKLENQEIRVTPSFRYNISNKLSFGGNTSFVNAFTTFGERKDCYDLRLENQYGFIYNLNPSWRFSVNYFREDRYLDLNYITFDTLEGYNKIKSEGYLLEQLRPTLLYILNNGSSVELSFRVPLNQGLNYISEGGNSDSDIYESRYGIKYNHKVSSTFSTYAGLNLVTTKYTKKSNGVSTRTSDLKTEVGFTYNFGF